MDVSAPEPAFPKIKILGRISRTIIIGDYVYLPIQDSAALGALPHLETIVVDADLQVDKY